MTDAPDDYATIPIICLGRDELEGGKLVARLLPVALYRECKSADECWDRASPFQMKEREIPRGIGTLIYKVPGKVNDEGRLTNIKMKFVFDNDTNQSQDIRRDWVSIWQARDEAERVAIRARKQRAKLEETDRLSDMLRPLKHQYGKTDRLGRLALEVVILDILRSA